MAMGTTTKILLVAGAGGVAGFLLWRFWPGKKAGISCGQGYHAAVDPNGDTICVPDVLIPEPEPPRPPPIEYGNSQSKREYAPVMPAMPYPAGPNGKTLLQSALQREQSLVKAAMLPAEQRCSYGMVWDPGTRTCVYADIE